MHIFKYSKREGTRAAMMAEQVEEPVKAQRSAKLISLAHEMSEEFREYYIGKDTEILMEEPAEADGRRYFTGYTKEYVKMAVKTDKNLSNTFVKGRVFGKAQNGLYLLVEF